MSKIIGKLAVIAGTTALTAVAGYFGATKTETGKKAVAAVKANETAKKAVAYGAEKVNAVRNAVEAHKEVSAITNFLKDNEQLRKSLFDQMSAGVAAKKSA